MRAKTENADADPEDPRDDPSQNPLLRIREAIEDRVKNFGPIFGEILQHYEKAEPRWFSVVLLTVVADGLRNLARHIEDPNDLGITWENPAIEVHFPVDWDWEGRNIRLIQAWSIVTEENPNRDVSPEFSAALWRYAWLSALSELTLGILLVLQKDDTCRIHLPQKLLDRVHELPKDEWQAAAEELAGPVLVGAREKIVDGARLLMMDGWEPFGSLLVRIGKDGGTEPADNLAALFDGPWLPPIHFSGFIGERAYGGTVILEFKPLTIEPEQQRAYFPLGVAIAFRPAASPTSDEQLEFLDPITWAEEDRRSFLKELRERIGQCAEQLRGGGEETREMTAARIVQSVLSQRDEGVVVTVGRAPVSKVPEVGELMQSVADLQRTHLKVTGAIAPIGVSGPTSAAPMPAAEPLAKATAKFPSPDGLSWAEVMIAFISNDALMVEASGIRKRYHFTELGLSDGRVGDRSSTRWAVLRKLATEGQISWSTRNLDAKERARLKAVIKDLRKVLCRLMSIDDDPFEPYRRVKAYRPRFRLEDRTCGDGEISPAD